MSLRPLINFIDAGAAAEIGLLQLGQLVEQSGLTASSAIVRSVVPSIFTAPAWNFTVFAGKRESGVAAGGKEQESCGKADDAENFLSLDIE